MGKRILIGHLNSNGDCLYATVIARQIKEVDFPGCHLTWGVSQYCRQSVDLNPHVDEIWEFRTNSLLATLREWDEFVVEARKRKAAGEFDEIFFTQIIGENMVNIDGIIRSSIYNNYPFPITVPRQPVLRLSTNEVDEVKAFAGLHQLSSFKHIVLMECGPSSFSSSLNPAACTAFAEKFAKDHPGTAFILSSNKKIEASPFVIDGSKLSFRQNAEITKYCTHFIGCSSGISWICTSDWAKPLPRIIITTRSRNFTYSMVLDHEYAGLDTSGIIEFPEQDEVMVTLSNTLEEAIDNSFSSAREKFHAPLRVKPYKFIYVLSRLSYERHDIKTPFRALRRTFKRKGFSMPVLFYFLKAFVKLPLYYMKGDRLNK